MSDRYWIYHCIDIARDAGSIDAARDAVAEIEQLKAERDAAVAELRIIASYEASARESVQKGYHNTTLAIDLSGRAGIFLAAIDAARGKT